jgi:hypothetical protein
MSDTQPIGGGLIKNDGYSRETVIHWGKYEYLMSGGGEGRGGEGRRGVEGGVPWTAMGPSCMASII